MTDFTAKMDERLHEYFAGVLTGRCGLRSSMGGQLQALAERNVERAPRGRVGDYMPVAPENRNTRDFDVTEDMMAAAREIGRMEDALALLERGHIGILRAHYVEPTKAPFRELAFVLGSDTLAIDLARRCEAEDRDARREARKERDSAVHRARVALEAAQEAFAAALDEVSAARKAERRARVEATFA